jgi:peptidoglycan biosynthesis protein MviN/MurJ (putative lipid II flippase)
MKLLIFAIAATAALVVLKFWVPFSWVSLEVIVGVGLALIAVTVVAAVGLCNRQRRRLTDMRDSALW